MQYRQNSTCCVASRHVMTPYLAHAFWCRKKSYVRAVSRMLYSKRDTSCLSYRDATSGMWAYATKHNRILDYDCIVCLLLDTSWNI